MHVVVRGARMRSKIIATVAAGCAAAVVLLPAAPASAEMRDCKIMGPEYVAEVVDCALYIYEIAIGWPR